MRRLAKQPSETGRGTSGADDPQLVDTAKGSEGRADVVIDAVSHYFGEQAVKPTMVVSEVSMSVPNGQFVAIVGPSGCGKTTLLNMVAGLVVPKTGTVTLGGEAITGPSPELGFMTARDGLLPWRTARDNAAFGLEIRGMARRARRERADALLELVGLRGSEHLHPFQLSQGMRQRVAIARVLANDPKIFLLDEPFAALDAQTKVVLQEEFVRIWDAAKKTVVLVTHDIGEAVSMADRIIVMSRRPGRIIRDIEVGLPRPRDPVATRFDSRFVDLTHEIWGELRHDIHSAAHE